MGLLDAIRGGAGAVPGPKPSSNVDRPTAYSPAAKAYVDCSVELSKQRETGKIDPKGAARLNEVAEKLTPADLRTMRYVAGDRMRAQLEPSTRDRDPQLREGARGLVRMIDNGILPGIGGAPTLFIDSGKPATKPEVEAAKKGWAP